MKNRVFLLCICYITFFTVFAQNEDEKKLDTEVINVVKSYDPTGYKFSKIKKYPKGDAPSNEKKILVNYDFLGLGVVSSFQAKPIQMKSLEKPKKKKFRNNFISVAVANYLTVNIDFYFAKKYKSHLFGIYLNHLSSEGGIDDITLDDSFAKNKAEFFHQKQFAKYTFTHNLGYHRNMNNYYGEVQGIDYSKNKDVKQVYHNFYLSGNINSNTKDTPFFESLTYKISHLTNRDNNVKELSTKANSKFNMKFGEEVLVAYLNAKYNDNSIGSKHKYKSKFFDSDVSLQFKITNKRFGINLGVKLSMNIDILNNKFKSRVYPLVEGNYAIIRDVMITYAGVRGDIHQNTYNNLVNRNPFLYESVTIQPTIDIFDVYFGMKGILLPNLTYDAMFSIKKQDNFVSFDYLKVGAKDDEVYKYKLKYNEVFFSSLNGVIKYSNKDNIEIGTIAKFNIYYLANKVKSKDKEDENLNHIPTVKLTLFSKYELLEGLQFGLDTFFVAGMKGRPNMNNYYTDVNFSSYYKLSDKLSLSLNLNNVLNQNYEFWSYYKVQGFQVIAGLTYRF